MFDLNKKGLPCIYNQAIEAAKSDPAILVFVHDDVHLCDFFWAERIEYALSHFQIIGVVGNKRRVPMQPSWYYLDTNGTEDARENFSGKVGHGTAFPPLSLNDYGPTCEEVKLLDGLLLICHSSTLINNDLRFDERFDFHFYDLDFCRQAELKGLKMGTWSISVIHESRGNLGPQGWWKAYKKYFEKWGE